MGILRNFGESLKPFGESLGESLVNGGAVHENNK